MPSCPRSSTLVKPTRWAAASPSGYLRLYSVTWWMPFRAERLDLRGGAARRPGAAARRSWGCRPAACRARRGVMPSSARQLAALLLAGLEVLGDGPDRGRRHAGGQDQAVAVDDAAAAGRQLERAGVAVLALALVEVGADDLDVDRAAEQHAEGRAEQRDQELGAPRRRLRGQQRAGRVADAAHAAVRLLALAHPARQPALDAALRDAHRVAFGLAPPDAEAALTVAT